MCGKTPYSLRSIWHTIPSGSGQPQWTGQRRPNTDIGSCQHSEGRWHRSVCSLFHLPVEQPRQIIHLYSLCNECGNCETFCVHMGNPAGLSAKEALWLATVGGARVLGRDDIGRLEPGKAADLIGFDLQRLDYAGALHDPLAALVFCTPRRVDLSVINGRVVVEDGNLLTVDLKPLIARHNRIAGQLVSGQP